MKMGGIFLAITIAQACVCGSAFQSRSRLGPHRINGDFFRRCNGRRYRSPWGPLFGGGGLDTDPSTVTYNRQYLTQTLGISEAKLEKKVMSGWNILTLEVGVLEERVRWLSERLGLKESEMRRIAQNQPHLLQKRSEDNLAPKLEYLQTRLLLDDASLRKLILTNPTVLGSSIEDNIEPKLDWLQQRLDLDDAEVSKMIQRLPSLLNYSIDNNLEPKLEWLQQRLGLDNDEVSKMIQRLPTLLAYSIDTNLEPTLQFYSHALGDKVGAFELVVQDPSLVSASVEKRLKPRLVQAQNAVIVINAGCLQRIAKYTNDQWDTSLTFQTR